MQVFNNGNHEFLYIDSGFLARTPVVMNITTSYEEIHRRLQSIDKMSKSLNVYFDDLVNQCYDLVCRLPLPLIDIDVDCVVRCRPNYEADGKVYSKVSDLSYNPNVSLIGIGRFNVEREPIFYASLPSESVNGSTSLTAILEA